MQTETLSRAGAEVFHVVVVQGFVHAVGGEAKAAIVGDFFGASTNPPLKIGQDVHGLQTGERVVDADEVEGGKVVKDDEGGFQLRDRNIIAVSEFRWVKGHAQ